MRAGCGPARCSPASGPGGHAGRARRSLPGRMRGSTARHLPGWWRVCRHASRALHRPRDKIRVAALGGVGELVAVGWGGMGLLVTVGGDKPARLTDAPAMTGWLAEVRLQIRPGLGHWQGE